MENKDLFNFEKKDQRLAVFHNFKENPEVMGILTEITTGEFGKMFNLEFEGKKIVIGSYSALSEKITEKDIGKPIKIVYLGTVKSKDSKRSYMDFEVYVKEIK